MLPPYLVGIVDGALTVAPRPPVYFMYRRSVDDLLNRLYEELEALDELLSSFVTEII